MRRCGLLLGFLALAGCGGGEDISEPDPTGGYADQGRERIAVLTFEQQLEADPSIADVRVVLPRPYRNASWPQSGGTATNAVHHLSLPDTLRRAWRTDIGRGSDLFTRMISAPIVAEGRVYTIDTRGLVTAMRTRDGRRVWERRLKMEGEKKAVAFGGGLAYADGILYATTGYGFIAAMEAGSGREVWRYNGIVPFRGAPTVTAGRLFALTQDNQLVAIDLDNGTLLWTRAGLPEDAGLLGAASPAVTTDTVIAAMSSGELLALRVENGSPAWQDTLSRTRRLTPLATLADIDGNPVVDRRREDAAEYHGQGPLRL